MSTNPITKMLNNLTKRNQKILSNREVEEEYVPFIMSLFLSFRRYALPFVAELNRYWQLPKRLQYLFLFYSVPKLGGFYPMSKKPKKAVETEVLADFYEVSLEKAAEYRELLTTKQMTQIMRFTVGRKI